MVKKCSNCNTNWASFGLKSGRATHCKKCKLDDMLDVHHRKCLRCNKKTPNFGMEGERPTHCADCKLNGMRDIRNKKCVVCKQKRPNFGTEGGRATHCLECQLDGMQNVNAKKCVVCDKKHPTFGVEGRRPSHCGDCKVDGMHHVGRRMCMVCNEKHPSFGTGGGGPTHCAGCKSDDMQNLISKRCATEGCDVISKSLYCANCDTDRKRYTRVRENQLANFLKENIDVPWTAWNKQLAGSRECGGSRRPDFVWLLPHLAIVTECDENQHDDRCLPGERQRMFDIFNTYGGIHTIYLRFNPDAFKVDGVTRRVSREKRYAILKKALDLELARTPEDVAKLPLFRVNYLFYDVTDNIYERKVFVPNEAYENAVWSEELIPDM